MRRGTRRLAWVGAVAALAALAGCRDSRPVTLPPPPPPLPQPSVTTTAPPAATAVTQPPQPVVQKLGEPFLLGDLRLTMLAVQDPFPPTPQVQPVPGNRLVSIKYEVVSQSSVTQTASDLPDVELRDPSGATYQSEHGRLSVAGGMRTPGELPAGKRMETSALFEVPGGVTGLQASFRPVAGSDRQGALVPLD